MQTKTKQPTPEQELSNFCHAVEMLSRLLLDANEVALRRGDKFGVCDSIDNYGNPYPSSFRSEWLEYASGLVAVIDETPAVD